MEVLVNEEQIDVELENENTLGEVVHELSNWLQGMNLYITDLAVDRASHHLDEEGAWADRSISEVGQIEIVALPPWEVRLNGLRVLHNYVDALADAVSRESWEESREILNEYPYIRQHMQEVIVDVFGRSGDTALDRATEKLDRVQKGENPSRHPEAEEEVVESPAHDVSVSLRQVSTVLATRIRELATPFQEAGRTEQALRTLMAELEEVSILLQTGEEQKAMTLIVSFSELVERLLRVLGAIEQRYGEGLVQPHSDEQPLREKTDELKATLEELVGAFSDRDTVLIGDLLEYDLLPRVEEILALVPAADGHEAS